MKCPPGNVSGIKEFKVPGIPITHISLEVENFSIILYKCKLFEISIEI